MNVEEFWTFNHKAPILGFELADINNNGKIEILAYTKTGNILIISLNGELLNTIIIAKDSPLWHLKICDIDGDGRNELICGGMDGIIRIFNCTLSYNLELLWTHKFDSSISGILVEDINSNGHNELIIFSLDKTLRVLNSLDGTLLWGQVFEDGVGDVKVFINDKNPSPKELLASSNNGTIRLFNGIDGKLLWFKKYSDKMRVITYMNTPKGPVVICGGDDKKLHIIDKKTLNEILTMEFNDYIWNCISYPLPFLNKILVSSYSFAYFDDSMPFSNTEFTSKLVCLNEYFDVKWELKGYNIEFIKIIKNLDKLTILMGTTKGEIFIIEESTSKILFSQNYNSCANMAHFFKEKNLLFSCHDNGKIFSSKLEEISL